MCYQCKCGNYERIGGRRLGKCPDCGDNDSDWCKHCLGCSPVEEEEDSSEGDKDKVKTKEERHS